MTDKELAIRIYKYFMNGDFWESEFKTLKTLYRIRLAGAFNWEETEEGHDFWCNIARNFSRNSISLEKFLKENLIFDSNFIELEYYV